LIEVRIPDIGDILSILFDDEIYDRISDDTCPPKEDYDFPEHGLKNIGCYLDDKIIGLAIIEENGKLHFQVLKAYRRHASKCLKACLKEIDDPLFCEIPLLYMSVINFAKKHGFSESGINDDTYIKNNKEHKILKLIYKG